MNNQRRKALARALPLLEQMQVLLKDIGTIIDDVKAEEGEAYDNLSEGAQNGDTGEAIQEALSHLEDATEELSSIDLKAVGDAISQITNTSAELQSATMTSQEIAKRQEARLPTWVRQRIAKAERDQKKAEEVLATSFGEPDEDNPGQIVIDDFTSSMRGKVIPAKQVCFPNQNLRVRYDEQYKAIEISIAGFGTLSVMPASANMVRVVTDRR